MAAPTFAQTLTIVAAASADSSNSTFHTFCVDEAQRRVCRARKWPELVVTGAFLNTVAAYQTGTVTTNGTTTITLSGGTWPSDVASGKYRFALSVNDPWYEVATRSSDSVILLAQAYIGASASGLAYIAYKSHVSLAAAVDRVDQMWLHDSGRQQELVPANTDEELADYAHHPSGVGAPERFMSYSRDGSGNKQVLLGPDTPDAIYRIEYTYRKKPTDGTFTGNLDDTRWHLISSLAKSLAYEPEFPDRAEREFVKYQALLREAWADEDETEIQSVRVGQDRVSFPGGGMNDLLSRGRVTGPSV